MWLKWQTLICHSSGDHQYEIRVPSWLGSGEHLPGFQMVLSSLCAHMVKSESETDTQSASFLGFPLVRAHPIGSGPYPYDLIYFHLNYPLRDTSPNTVTLGIRASICEFGKRGHKWWVHNFYEMDIYFHGRMIVLVYLPPLIVFTVLLSLYFFKLYLMIV